MRPTIETERQFIPDNPQRDLYFGLFLLSISDISKKLITLGFRVGISQSSYSDSCYLIFWNRLNEYKIRISDHDYGTYDDFIYSLDGNCKKRNRRSVNVINQLVTFLIC